MKPDVLVTDFSGVYEQEGFLSYLCDTGTPFHRVDLRGLEGTSCYCSPESEEEIRCRTAPWKSAGIRWIDSGDYHYLTKILAGGEKEPFTLVLIDNHPDDQEPSFGGVLSCGSWVKDLRESSPMLEDVWTLGPEHRIRNASAAVDRELEEGIDDLLAALEGKRVYLSVDKDVLCRIDARTDWDQGSYRLSQLKGWLDGLLTLDVIAVDLCGECPEAKGATPEDLMINLETNIELHKLLCQNL